MSSHANAYTPEVANLTGLDPALDDLFHAEAARQKALSAREKRERDILLAAAREMLKTANGKRLFVWLLNETGVFASCFTGNSTTFFLEGKRAVGLALYRLLMTAHPLALQDLITFMRGGEQAAGTEEINGNI